MKMGGMAATNIPKIPSPASNHRKCVIFMDHQKMEPPNFTVPKVAETTPTVALTRVLLWQGGVIIVILHVYMHCSRLFSLFTHIWKWVNQGHRS